ncbi:MAG: ABC transporter ATP-binding protein [Candidatus Dormibacteraeota bacterium]|nr:ABC transporter ATP-binding protein [Candidatus Dormibacteraeota bacterium]
MGLLTEDGIVLQEEIDARTVVTAAAPVIQVDQLSKRYGELLAVSDLSFSVPEGSIFALTGPNGSGKTTTVECMEGLREADAGRVRVLGMDPFTERRRLFQQLGVQLQENSMHTRLRLEEALWMWSAFYDRPANGDELLKTFGLLAKKSMMYGKLSGGEKRRFLTALAFIGSPKVLILDEPTTGLDPQARYNVWQTLHGYARDGTTILLTTHNMDEAEAECDLIAIIDHGHLLSSGTPKHLLDEHGLETRVALPKGAAVSKEDVQQRREALGVRSVESVGDQLVVYGKGAAFLREVSLFAQSRGVQATDIEIRRARLEDLFLLLTGREYRED